MLGANALLQLKVWLLTISPMVWRRLLVPAGYSLRELHGAIQVAMGWAGIHLYQFRLRAARHGSFELSASSPDVTIESLQPPKRGSIHVRVRLERLLAPRNPGRRSAGA